MENDILYIDCNNLYGAAMQYKMPISDYRWLNQKEINSIDFASIDIEGEWGFIADVDLHYPSHLHELHNNFPLAPESKIIDNKDLSPYSKHVNRLLNNSTKKFTEKKLTSTFNDRINYIIHGKNLQTYIKLGMELTKVHRVILFKQTAYLQEFINFCTYKRSIATSTFEKTLMKLMANAL